jgi:hypothetical protein
MVFRPLCPDPKGGPAMCKTCGCMAKKAPKKTATPKKKK